MGKSRKTQGKSKCEVCGKYQEQGFEVFLGGERHVFDSFECASLGLLPRCARCGCTVHVLGIMVDDILYCSYSCASLYSLGDVEKSGWLLKPADL